MVVITFDVDPLSNAYSVQLKGVKSFNINRTQWHGLFKDPWGSAAKKLRARIKRDIRLECENAQKVKPLAEKEWRACEQKIVRWIREMTKLDFKRPSIRVSIVAFPMGVVPFRDIPFMIVGKSKNWNYPETIAHELAHVIFNQNFDFGSEVEHPYVQLIEEEVAIRLGVRNGYFAYPIPDFAVWVHRAQRMKQAWLYYLRNLDEFRDIGEFIKNNERKA